MPARGMIPIFAQAIIYAMAQLLFNASWCEGVRWGCELLNHESRYPCTVKINRLKSDKGKYGFEEEYEGNSTFIGYQAGLDSPGKGRYFYAFLCQVQFLSVSRLHRPGPSDKSSSLPPRAIRLFEGMKAQPEQTLDSSPLVATHHQWERQNNESISQIQWFLGRSHSHFHLSKPNQVRHFHRIRSKLSIGSNKRLSFL